MPAATTKNQLDHYGKGGSAGDVQSKPVAVPVTPDSNLVVAPRVGQEIAPTQEVFVLNMLAGETRIVNKTGNQFYVVESPNPLNIRARGSSFNQYPARTGRRLASGFFTQLEVTNTSGNPIGPTLSIGNDFFIDNRFS